MFDKIISGIIGTIVGAASAYFVTTKVMEKKYQAREDAAVASVREALGKPRPKPTEDNTKQAEAAEKAAHKPSINDYAKYTKSYISKEDEPIDGMETANLNKEIGALNNEPYVIEPQEFGMMEYETVSLTLYADGTLVDEDEVPLTKEEAEDMVGKDATQHIGDYEEDAVHIRNDLKETDYEILRDEQTWEAYLDAHPYLRRE